MSELITLTFPKPEDVESTAAPWWVIVDPRLVDPEDVRRTLPAAFKGPFFSRPVAESYLKACRNEFSEEAFVYCKSGSCSDAYCRAWGRPVESVLPRLREIERRYQRLLAGHLKVMLREGKLVHSGGLAGQAELMREMAEAGLLEIVASGPDNILSGRLTGLGEALIKAEEAAHGL